MSKTTNYPLFATGLILAFLLCLCIIPGLDFLAWRLLHPVGFWQRFLVVGVEFVTFWPRILFAGFLFAIIGKISADVS